MHSVDRRRLRRRPRAEARGGFQGLQRLHYPPIKLVGRRPKQASAAEQDDKQLGQRARQRHRGLASVIHVVVVFKIMFLDRRRDTN